MGWGIIINNVYLNKVTKNELPGVIEECELDIRNIREKIMILAASTPRQVEEIDWTDYIHREITDLMSEYEDTCIKLHLARIALENPQDTIVD